ncbi:MAG: hypothetical protein U0992_04580 [Planctomycetaceae bacterium]
MLSIERLDNWISRAPLIMFGGFAVFAIALWTQFGYAIAISLTALGCGLICARSYKSERGLWMLALLIGVSFLAIALVCEFGMLRDAFRGAPQPDWTYSRNLPSSCNSSGSSSALLSVVVYNRRLTS